jgi:hypothetical protein
MNASLLPDESSYDRTIRVALGLALIALVFVGPKSLCGWLGIVPLLPGMLGSCPLYRALAVSTCWVDRRR